MEEFDALRIVESLRGRLIAERAASKTAKYEADQMENKLIELERQVKEEIKLRNRVEKKLMFLKKKLETLNNTSELRKHNLYTELDQSSKTNDPSTSPSSRASERKSEDGEEDHHINDPMALVMVSNFQMHQHARENMIKVGSQLRKQ